MTDLIITRAERLCLLRSAHNARRSHAPTKTIMKRLRAVTARLAAMEGKS